VSNIEVFSINIASLAVCERARFFKLFERCPLVSEITCLMPSLSTKEDAAVSLLRYRICIRPAALERLQHYRFQKHDGLLHVLTSTTSTTTAKRDFTRFRQCCDFVFASSDSLCARRRLKKTNMVFFFQRTGDAVTIVFYLLRRQPLWLLSVG
jgi:hypothetical protein